MTPSPEQRFTDEDLAKMKLLVGRSEEGANVFLAKTSFDFLLSRMEKAEKFCIYFHKDDPYLGIDEIEALKAWRKASGK